MDHPYGDHHGGGGGVGDPHGEEHGGQHEAQHEEAGTGTCMCTRRSPAARDASQTSCDLNGQCPEIV